MALAVPGASLRPASPAWTLAAAAVLVQIAYPLMPEAWRTEVTITSVVVFFLAVVVDTGRVHGPSGAAWLVVVAGGLGLLAEAIGVATGWPFGDYAYTGTLGAEIFGVPVVVPMAWVMMAWPALVVARTLAVRGPAVIAVGAAALTAWDVFLDPQMVAAGHWTWSDPSPGLPLVPGIPLTNYVGWLLVSAAVIAILNTTLDREAEPSAPAAALYLWVYFSSVLAHLVFFGLPGSAVTGGLLMGAVAIPFAIKLLRLAHPPRRPNRKQTRERPAH
ncbi:membrane protein [Mycobacterium antarcticum]|uniref:carotenoid biosynthesis protein n=1 Tax=unclassified Mycolicibacterium TaxID=2636767 RepID=UPI0023A05016|nr:MULTISPECIES: carotenoid biosynthesis protein [unclassified Mycolicibacterium]BDX35082.1 membrane protein [Mycolicibacterium sp. TUM20985]GLP81361.1 membrane protein [Mycolicibacterium sp. TUM20984]